MTRIYMGETTEINIGGTLYKAVDGVADVENQEHVKMMLAPVFGFGLAPLPEAVDVAAVIAEAVKADAESLPNVVELLIEHGHAIASMDAHAMLVAVDAVLGLAPAATPETPPTPAKPVTEAPVADTDPRAAVMAELTEMGVAYPAKAKLEVLVAIRDTELATRKEA
jgi:hypothetical protein